MNSDYPEINIFSKSTSGAYNQLDWIIRYLYSESSSPFYAFFNNASSGEKSQFGENEITCVVTDPPYYNAIAYADISDYFYLWLKRSIGDIYPLNFSTPQTPKAQECTALKHHHNNSEEEAKKHFEKKLTEIFDAIRYQTSDIVSIMFAHQSTEAWTTLCNSILDARMNITGSWAIDSERDTRMIANAGAALESSVTVACRPSKRQGYGDFKEVKKAISEKVEHEVESLYSLGFRGADLMTACFGQAVSEFGKYKVVEKADGSEVTVPELLDLARNLAFNSLLKGVQGDDFTRFYIGWLQMNGMGETDFDDATKFTRVGMQVDVSEIFAKNILIREGKKQHLATAKEHLGDNRVIGTRPEDSLIDQVHRCMLAYDKGDRTELLQLLHRIGAEDIASPFWRLLATLQEILPDDSSDLKLVRGLLGNSDNLRQESRDIEQHKPEQMTLDFGAE
jgi:adenine-specific DNA methylase